MNGVPSGRNVGKRGVDVVAAQQVLPREPA